MQLLRLFSTFVLLFATTPTWAGLFFELSAGRSESTINATNLVAPNEDGKTFASTFGARLGLGVGPIWCGVHGLTGVGKYDSKNNAVVDGDWRRLTSYATIGLQFGFLRIWYDHGLDNELLVTKVENSIYTTTKYKGGTSYKAGVGVRFGPHWSLNGEYFVNKPKFYDPGIKSKINSVYSKWAETGTLISISYTFGG